MANFRYHKITKTKKIRYISKINKGSPFIVFLHGFMSDLEGEKPKALKQFQIFKDQIRGFLGIGSAPEFLENLMWKKLGIKRSK